MAYAKKWSDKFHADLRISRLILFPLSLCYHLKSNFLKAVTASTDTHQRKALSETTTSNFDCQLLQPIAYIYLALLYLTGNLARQQMGNVVSDASLIRSSLEISSSCNHREKGANSWWIIIKEIHDLLKKWTNRSDLPWKLKLYILDLWNKCKYCHCQTLQFLFHLSCCLIGVLFFHSSFSSILLDKDFWTWKDEAQ